MLKPLTAAAALLAASVLVLPTVSQARAISSGEEVNSAVVSYADLNLSSAPGQDTLQRRIKHAARDVCVYETSRDLKLSAQVDNCRSEAIARAQPGYEVAVASARQGTVTVASAATLTIASE